MDSQPYYQTLVDHYEKCFEQFGPTPQGVDWPNAEDLLTRFAIMLDVCRGKNHKEIISLLDLGCGYGAFLEYLYAQNLLSKFSYQGIDLSSKMIQTAKERHPSHSFAVRNILQNTLEPESVDYVIMNGLLTEKRNLSQAEMENFMLDILQAAFSVCRQGIAFNIMNFHVAWFRDELFYLPLDRLFELVKLNLSRHISIRADYGLFEYTVYVYKQATL